ncbi:MAG: hypothetical protein Q7K57_57220 [Burkholderiaceae bacterium]|nr:hypothetical protein [Burkholderiaceae bacterium]
MSLLLHALGVLPLLWAFYLATMNLKAVQESGELTGWVLWAGLLLIAGPAVLLDWLVNIILFTVIFCELPGSWRELVTQRVSRHCGKPGWRGWISSHVCHDLLNRFAPGRQHCTET